MKTEPHYRLIGVPLSVGSSNNDGTQGACGVLCELIRNNYPTIANYNIVKCANDLDSTDQLLANKYSVLQANQMLYEILHTLTDEIPIIIGGDHSIGIGVTANALEKYDDQLLVVWIDAHADINTPQTSPSHYIHGMPNAVSMGLCDASLSPIGNAHVLKGDHLAIIGGRSIDSGEWDILHEKRVNTISPSKLRQVGIKQYICQLKRQTGCHKVQISFDVDVLDDSVFTSTGYNIPNGLLPEEVKDIIKELICQFELISFDCVEYNPDKDKDKKDLNTLIDILSVLFE